MATVTPTKFGVEAPLPRENMLGHGKLSDSGSIDASPTLVLEEDASGTVPILVQASVDSVCDTPASAFAVVPPAGETGAFPTEPCISKREEIRKRLREKERALTRMIAQRDAQPSCSSSIDDDSCASELPKVIMYGKEEADRREAIRVLSQAALAAAMKLKVQKEESCTLRNELKSLSNSLQEGVEQKSQLENEVRRLRDENNAVQQQLAAMQKNVGEQKSMSGFDGDGAHDKGSNLQNKLAAAYEEVVWTQKDASSKNEQLEYCEYQLLAKNQEIDDLKQELHSKTRRIVELEVDLEIHDDRFLSVMGEFGKTPSVEGTLATAGGDNTSSPPKELVLDNTHGWQKERKKRNLIGIMSWRKKKVKEPVSLGSMSACEEMPSPSVVDHVTSDFKALETRYRKERHQNRVQVSQLKQENNEYLVKILSLEKALQAARVRGDSESSLKTGLHPSDSQEGSQQVQPEFRPERPPCKTRFLEERVETLESERVLQSKTIENLHAQIEKMKRDAEREKIRTEQVTQHCLLECDAQELKLAALEQDLKELTLDGSHRSTTKLFVDAAAELETKLLDAQSEVVKQRNALEIKDQKIGKLRTEVIELRYARMLYEKGASASAPSSQEHARDASATNQPPTDETSTFSASSHIVSPYH